MIADTDDKYHARRTRLTSQIAERANAVLMRKGHRGAQKALDKAYQEARTMALRGDGCPAEALAEFLRVHLSALRAHQGASSDWASVCRYRQEVRLFQAVQAICAEAGFEDETR